MAKVSVVYIFHLITLQQIQTSLVILESCIMPKLYSAELNSHDTWPVSTQRV